MCPYLGSKENNDFYYIPLLIQDPFEKVSSYSRSSYSSIKMHATEKSLIEIEIIADTDVNKVLASTAVPSRQALCTSW
jgi:hypothetical protein